MARVPQIPPIEYGGPAGGSPNVATGGDGGEKALALGADALGDLAGTASRNAAAEQARLDKLRNDKQKIVDEVTATRSSGDYEEALRDQTTSIQQRNVDTPDKAPGEFIDTARRMADDALKGAPNDQVGLKLAQKTAQIIEQGTKEMHAWVSDRQTQKAKSDLSVMVNQATRGAEDQLSAAGLPSFAAEQHARLDPVFDQLKDPGEAVKAKAKLDEEIVKSWATAASARDPVGTMKALDAQEGYLVDHSSVEDRKALRALAETSFTGMGKFKEMQALKEGIDSVGGAYDLYRTGELTSGTALSMIKAFEQKRQAVTLDPNVSPESKKAQLETLKLQSDTVRLLDEANRKQTGYDPANDDGTRETLFADHAALFEPKGKANPDLSAVLKFRHDLAKAFSGGQISPAVFGTLDKSVSLALPKSLAKESRNTWQFPWHLINWRSPQQSGNRALNEYLDEKTGPFGNLTLKQKNDARQFYIEFINDAREQGGTVDEDSTQVWARKAAYLAAEKPLPRGGVK